MRVPATPPYAAPQTPNAMVSEFLMHSKSGQTRESLPVASPTYNEGTNGFKKTVISDLVFEACCSFSGC